MACKLGILILVPVAACHASNPNRPPESVTEAVDKGLLYYGELATHPIRTVIDMES